ncbi:phosphoribosyltransferase [Alphaproteobacteria bacterium]|nr:phosphoribosyltransferase [Alphaproteobacteria bacterium]
MSNVYFKDRKEAGEELSELLVDAYRYEDCAVVALSDGGVMVGEPIAEKLHSILTMVLTEDITLPGDNLVVGSASQNDVFSYNNQLTTSEVDEYMAEFHSYIEQERRVAHEKINRLIGDGGAFDRDLLIDRNIILVSDGLFSGSIIGAAMEYLKPVRIKKLIVALPLANVAVVDYVHVHADEVHILDVKEDFMGVDHYYEDNKIPTHEEIVDKLNRIIMNWR